MMKEPILECKNLSISFGGLKAVDSVSLKVNKGEVYGLIGPNGAGKTTLFNMITKFYECDSGEIIFDGENLSKEKNYNIIKKGLVRTFQNVELFKGMTLLENILVGQHTETKYSMLHGIIRSKKYRETEKAILDRAMEILEFLNIEQYAQFYPSQLPYGIQKSAELARALVLNPKMVILDEPAAGMNNLETEQLGKQINRLREELGITVFMIEHDMKLVMNICDRITVLNFGKKIAEGSPDEIKNNKNVIEAYLGGE